MNRAHIQSPQSYVTINPSTSTSKISTLTSTTNRQPLTRRNKKQLEKRSADETASVEAINNLKQQQQFSLISTTKHSQSHPNFVVLMNTPTNAKNLPQITVSGEEKSDNQILDKMEVEK